MTVVPWLPFRGTWQPVYIGLESRRNPFQCRAEQRTEYGLPSQAQERGGVESTRQEDPALDPTYELHPAMQGQKPYGKLETEKNTHRQTLWNSVSGSTTWLFALSLRTSSVSLWCVLMTSALLDASPEADSIRSGRRVPWPKTTSSGSRFKLAITCDDSKGSA